MTNLTVKDILKKCKGQLICGKDNEEIINVSQDTRTLKQGDTFIAISGQNSDANTYIEDAIRKGAKICIVEKVLIKEEDIKKLKNITIIRVENTRQTLIEMATMKRELYNIPVIAITGSVGKTSTKDIIAVTMSKKFNVLKTEGNFNNSIGLPLTILKLKDHDALVVEMGMNHLGEIDQLTKIAKPTISIITNIGTSHIGNLGSRENILKAKLEILNGMDDKGKIIINNDNDLLHKWNLKDKKYNKITFGIEEKSDYTAENINILEEKNEFDINIKNKKYKMKTNKSGTPFIYNALAAVAVGMEFDIPIEKISEALQEVDISKNRMEVEKLENDITCIKDFYNASFESIKPSLEYLMKLHGGKKIAVLGDIKELGKFSKELHEKVGEEVARNKIDILITVGNEAKNIAYKAKEKGSKEIYICKNNLSAVVKLKEIVKPGDKILLKASNSMKFGQIYDKFKEKIKIGIIVGGMSTEHDVSLQSGKSIAQNIDKEQYISEVIYINQKGKCFKFIGKIDDLDKLNINDLEEHDNLIDLVSKEDVVFPVLHGKYGEDGTIQGLFEMINIPYVGCGVLASSVCMDKVYTKIILDKANINQAKYCWIKKEKDKYIFIDEKLNEQELELKEICEKIHKKLKYPMFVKPSNAGSSIGILKVNKKQDLKQAIEYASTFDSKIIIEQGIEGREVECGVLGNDNVKASCIGEILPAEEFYSYEAKYNNSNSKTIIPAKIDKDIEKNIKKTAIQAFRAVDGKGISRVDFFIEKDTNKIILNEINTMPGFTKISMYPKLFEQSGIEYSKLIDKLIKLAIEK